jgi:diguanylate cyclase
MMFHPPGNLDVKKDPYALLRLFVICSIASSLGVLLLAGFGFRGILLRYITTSAENDAIHVSRALLAEEMDRIVTTRDGVSRIEVQPAQMPQLDRHLRMFLAPFSIVKIKIYSEDCRIVYSTDRRIIGEVNSSNARLRNALAGHYDSKLERKDQVQDLADEVKFNVDVVETYIPIVDRNHKVIGSFEIYLDVTPYREQWHRAMALFLGILVLILLLGFGWSFPFLKKRTVEVKEIQEMLRHQNMTDALTGIFNKRQIMVIACNEFSRASRRREKGLPEMDLALIMIDIDRFKSVNDIHGHLAGDTLLKALAERIAASLRSYDSVGRFGGEEFLVVLPGADLLQAMEVAMKIWRLIREEPFMLEGEPVVITASLGIGVTEEGDTECDEILKRADQALYRAKEGGRDQVAA